MPEGTIFRKGGTRDSPKQLLFLDLAPRGGVRGRYIFPATSGCVSHAVELAPTPGDPLSERCPW